MVETTKEMMTISSFLEIYGISQSKFEKEVKKGVLKTTKENGSRRTYIKRKDADEWLKNFGND